MHTEPNDLKDNFTVQNLVRAYDVGRMLGYSTHTVKKWARQGLLPGAVFLRRHIRFIPERIDEFIKSGGHLEAPPSAKSGSPFVLRHIGPRDHAYAGDCKRRGERPTEGEVTTGERVIAQSVELREPFAFDSFADLH